MDKNVRDLHSESHRHTLLPSASYFFQVIRRQLFFATLMAVVAATGALYTARSTRDTYFSEAIAVYDPRDSAEQLPRFPNYPSFAQIAQSFKARVYESEFLYSVANQLGWTTTPYEPSTTIMSKIKKLIDRSDETTAQDAHKRHLVEVLRKMIQVDTDEKSMSLTIRAIGDNAESVQRVVRITLEYFIETELRQHTESATRQYETYTGYLRQERSHLPNAGASAPTTEARALKMQEQNLLDRIQQFRARDNDTSSEQNRRKATLENELAHLETRLQPEHPDVLAKRDELARLEASGNPTAIRTKLEELRGELSRVRSQQLALGLATSLDDSPPPEGLALRQLEDRIGELALERANLARQVDDPSARTRFRISKPASYEPTPVHDSTKKAFTGALVLGTFALIVLSFLRELLSPRARDAWRIAAVTRLPLVAEWLRENEPLRTSDVDELRLEMLRGTGRKSNPVRLFRTFAKHLAATHQGQIILVVSADGLAQTSAVFHNFLNTFARDISRRVLVIDFDVRDPIARDSTDISMSSTGMWAFLAGQTPWKEVLLSSTADRAYDLVPAPDGASVGGNYVALMQPRNLDKVLTQLKTQYAWIFVRGMDFRNGFENASLADAASDVFLIVDQSTALFSTVRQALADLPRSKLRGFVTLREEA